MANYRLSSSGGRSYTRAPRVSVPGVRGTRGQVPLSNAGATSQGGMAPAKRVGGSMGYRRNQDQAATAGGTKF